MGFLTGSGSTKKAAAADLTGFNYLKSSPLASSFGANGAAANDQLSNLLGLNGAQGSAQSSPGFQNYLNSTGYQFQMQQGQDAIASSQAARGLLNSGGTAKELEQYGQGLASTSFNNYLSQVGNVAAQGENAYATIGGAGNSGGQAAGAAWNNQANQQSGLFGSVLGFGLGFIPHPSTGSA